MSLPTALCAQLAHVEMPHVLPLKVTEKYSGASGSIFFLSLFDGERRSDIKFDPFVCLSIWHVCGSIIGIFSLRIVMLGESGNT